MHHVFNRSDSVVGVLLYVCTVSSILLSVAVSVVQSFPSYRQLGPGGNIWFQVEAGCIAAFALDYVARLVSCMALPWTDEAVSSIGVQQGNRDTPSSAGGALGSMQWLWRAVLRKLARFVVSPLNVCDALAIFPFFIELTPSLPSTPTAAFRILRLLRLLRLLVIGGTGGVAVFARTLRAAADALGLLLFVVLLSALFFSSAMFYCEQVPPCEYAEVPP